MTAPIPQTITKPSQWVQYIYQDIPPEAGTTNITIWNRQSPNESTHIAPPGDALSALVFDDQVASLVAAGKDAYYGVGLTRPHLTESQKGKASDVRGLPGLWLDIDMFVPDLPDGATPHAAQNLPRTEENVLEILAGLPVPTAAISSGFGWHVYWLFDRVQPVGYVDQGPLASLFEQFQRKAIARSQALGWHCDYTANIDRVLRLPGTINTKCGLNKPVEVLFSDGPRYASVNQLMQEAEIDSRTNLPDSVVSAITGEISPELLRPRADIVQAQTSDYIRDSLSKLHNPESLELMAKVLAGHSFANLGERDRVLQKVSSILAYLAPDRSPKEIAQDILGPSLQTWDHDDRGKYTQQNRIDWAEEKISRAQEDARRDRVIRERQDKALADVLLKQARSAPRRDQRLGPAPSGAYTDKELAAFAKQQSTTIQAFQARWIIQKGPSFYVYVNGDYQLPLTATELDVSLPRDLAPAVQQGYIKLSTITAKGEPRSKTTKEILSDYASVARTVISSLAIGHSTYDDQTQTFYEASCPLRPLDPAYNPEVDAWLKALGGSSYPKLLDWVATVTALTRASSALYLQGPPGIGKGLLALGLARLWHQGPPTDLIRVLGQWTEDIARCPLILADEAIPSSFKGQRTSAELRSLIGTSDRTLARKYLSNSALQGSIRLILAANNADMLVFDEVLSQADLEAISGRFLHIICDRKAKTYLDTIKTDGWVDSDTIAKHALWMRDHHSVIYGKRFIVEGSAKDMSKTLATKGFVSGRVVEWLVRFICDPKGSNIAAQAGLVIIGDGQYLVNTNAIANFWDNYIKSSKVPTTPQIGSALRNLARGQVRANGKRYFSIDVGTIVTWSDVNLVGDPELICSRVNAVTNSGVKITEDSGSESLETL